MGGGIGYIKKVGDVARVVVSNEPWSCNAWGVVAALTDAAGDVDAVWAKHVGGDALPLIVTTSPWPNTAGQEYALGLVRKTLAGEAEERPALGDVQAALAAARGAGGAGGAERGRRGRAVGTWRGGGVAGSAAAQVESSHAAGRVQRGTRGLRAFRSAHRGRQRGLELVHFGGGGRRCAAAGGGAPQRGCACVSARAAASRSPRRLCCERSSAAEAEKRRGVRAAR
jgi:hypothetical protein